MQYGGEKKILYFVFVFHWLYRPHMYLSCQVAFVCRILVCLCLIILDGLCRIWFIMCVCMHYIIYAWKNKKKKIVSGQESRQALLVKRIQQKSWILQFISLLTINLQLLYERCSQRNASYLIPRKLKYTKNNNKTISFLLVSMRF